MSTGDITVIGGGWSVRNLSHLDTLPGAIIAVNDSAIYAPRWDYAVSMDRLWAEHRIGEVSQLMHGWADLRQLHIRRNALQNLEGWKSNAWIHSFECDHESVQFDERWGHLNGSNSGVCALNLAWKFKPRRVFLLGFDMNRDPKGRAYWYPPYPWSTAHGSTGTSKYMSWAGEFTEIAREFKQIGTQVFNVSPASSIDIFEKLTPKQFDRMRA